MEYEIKLEGYDDPAWEPERHIPTHLIEELSSKNWNIYLIIRNFAKFSMIKFIHNLLALGSFKIVDTIDVYYVEEILWKRQRGGRMEYEIKWEAYDDPTWEPEYLALTLI